MPIIINTRNKFLRIFLWLILIIYTAVLTKLVIFKRPLRYVWQHYLQHYSWVKAKANMHNANLKPFTTIKLYLNANMHAEYAISNLLGNIVGFIPLGILLPFLFYRLRSAAATILLVFLISLGFELFQLFTRIGICDIDDLILNTAGGMIGYFLFWILQKVFTIK